MQRFSVSITYPGSLREISAMLTDPSFLSSRVKPLGLAGINQNFFKKRNSEDGFTPLTERLGSFSLDSDELVILSQLHAEIDQARIPAKIRRFAPTQADIQLQETWPKGAFALTAKGLPVKLNATQTLVEETTESGGVVLVRQISGQVCAQGPLVGGQLEKLALGQVDKVVKAEQKAAKDWLAKHH